MLKIEGKLTNNNNSSKEMRQIELKLKKKEPIAYIVIFVNAFIMK
jgi:hypothetical protein